MRGKSYLFGTLLLLAAAPSCGKRPSGATPDATSDASGGVDASTLDAVAACDAACTDEQVCVGAVGGAGGTCCAKKQACGDTCCGDGDVCSFGVCRTPGAACVEAGDCASTEYCEFSLGTTEPNPPAGCVAAVPLRNGKCLPTPPSCAAGQDPGNPPTCLQACEYRPPAAAFSPTLKYTWGSLATPSTADSVMMAPVVIQLDDDNCDGVVNERDIPEIVFSTFTGGQYNANGTVHAISIVNGVVTEKWTYNAGTTSPVHPGSSIAAGNFDGQPGNEIAVCTTDGRVRALNAMGQQLWLSDVGGCGTPSLADFDQDGRVEVLTNGMIINGVTGAKLVGFGGADRVAYDINGDAQLDIVSPLAVLASDGTTVLAQTSGIAANYVAIGDLDRDGNPEIIATENAQHRIHIWHYDANAPGHAVLVRQNIDINGTLDANRCAAGSAGRTRGGGPPTVADFNGDGFPDVALAGGVGYAVFNGKKLMDPSVANPDTLLWSKATQDCSSAATGSSVFDFNGDGSAEVVYGDELKLHIYDGKTGDDLFETCNTNGTLVEYPLVADVDNDNQADIVVVSNNYSGFNCGGIKTTGVRVFGDTNGNWVSTRRVWNQHNYHVTNVTEAGEIPTVEPSNISMPRLNNYRQNIQPTGEFSAPDLVAKVECAQGLYVAAEIRNLGTAAAPPGVPVSFFLGDPAAGGTEIPGSPVTTVRSLFSTESELVRLNLTQALPADATIYVVVDRDVNHSWRECRTENNTAIGMASCAIE